MFLAAHTPPFRAVEVRLPRDPGAAAEARRAVRDIVPFDEPGLRQTTQLLTSELVSNAVKHGDGDAVRISIVLSASHVRVEVVDGGSPEGIAVRDGGLEGGYGLNLVETLARRWGVAEGSSHVWFELDRG